PIWEEVGRMFGGELVLIGAGEAPHAVAADEQARRERAADAAAGAGEDEVHARFKATEFRGAGKAPCGGRSAGSVRQGVGVGRSLKYQTAWPTGWRLTPYFASASGASSHHGSRRCQSATSLRRSFLRILKRMMSFQP